MLNKDGKPPLWVAADLGLPGHIARLLLEAGADKEGKSGRKCGNIEGKEIGALYYIWNYIYI